MLLSVFYEPNLNSEIHLENILLLNINKDKFKLSISEIMSRFGSYDNYLKSIASSIDDEFMVRYYPEHKEDLRFRFLLNILNPIIITNVIVVNKLYLQINLYNNLVSKMVLLSELVNTEMSKTLFAELKKSRLELIDTLRVLGEEEINVDGLLETFNTKIKKKILLDSAINTKIKLLNIDGNENFVSLFNNLIKIVYKDANFFSVDGERSYDTSLLQNNIVDLKGSVMELFSIIEIMKEYDIGGLTDSCYVDIINKFANSVLSR